VIKEVNNYHANIRVPNNAEKRKRTYDHFFSCIKKMNAQLFQLCVKNAVKREFLGESWQITRTL